MRVVPLFLVLAVAVGCQADPIERRRQIYDLKSEPSERNVGKIRNLLGDPDGDVRATALHALVSIPVPDAAALAVDALADDYAFVRATAAKLIGDLQHRGAIPTLVERVRYDPHPIARQRCAETLAALGGDAAQEGLELALEDPIKEVRLAAVRGLRSADRVCCFERLSRMVLEDAEWEVRALAARAVARTEDEGAVPVLQAALQDDNEFVRAAARKALSDIGSLPAGEQVVEEPVKGGAALGKLGN